MGKEIPENEVVSSIGFFFKVLDLQDRHSHNVWHLFFCNNEALLKTRFAKGIIYSCTTRKLENGKPQGKITISRQSHQK